MSGAIPKQISVASLWAEDVPTAVRFYSEVIGLGICPCQGYHIDASHFDVGEAYLAILKGKSVLAQDSETFPVIALAIDDLDSAIERLKAHHLDLLKRTIDHKRIRMKIMFVPSCFRSTGPSTIRAPLT